MITLISSPKQHLPKHMQHSVYITRTIIIRSWFETALDNKPHILDPTIEEFPCLVHKLCVPLTALQYKPQWKKWGKNICIFAHFLKTKEKILSEI